MGLPSPYSPYAVAENGPIQWKPGEELASSGFLAMSLLLFLDINIGVWRVFKKRRGLYYWSMTLGTWGILVDTIGTILKYYLQSKSLHLWPISALFMFCGWSVYVPAELFVLYSRLHLVNQSRKLKRWVLVLIISSMVAVIPPVAVMLFFSFDPKHSSVWSPRMGFLLRFNQTVFSIVEFTINGIYVRSLVGLLKLKRSVRQRRVMLDLIYVNIIAVCFDILVVILQCTNQLGLGHPIQYFSYAVKLKLEFVVLNQLMAVAARGLQKETFAERRYHHPSTESATDPLKSSEKSFNGIIKESQNDSTESSLAGPKDLVIPASVLPKPSKAASASYTNRYQHEESENRAFEAEQGIYLGNYSSYTGSEVFPGDIDRDDANSDQRGHLNTSAKRSLHHPFRRYQRKDSASGEILPVAAKVKRDSKRKGRSGHDEDDEEEEIGIHMWEVRGNLVLEVPWFKKEADP
ncbi:hypothetical protein MMC28_007480 [Mycoblastus sanguinarius]|nr:hypothetical protein [Mycoblastus sanguinarius]